MQLMFFLVFGSSAAGKSYVLDRLRGQVDRLEMHDFNDLGAPPRPDRRWRYEQTETWVKYGLRLQERGTDMLLAGQVPLGELLAVPSAPHLEAISACLLDCDDQTRIARLTARGEGWFEEAGGTIEDYLGWAAWLRGHAADPRFHREVLGQAGDLALDRFSGWAAGDPRWSVRLVDSDRPVEEVVADLELWIARERHSFASGEHALAAWASTLR